MDQTIKIRGVRSESRHIHVGDIIKCIVCGTESYEVILEIVAGQYIDVDNFKAINGAPELVVKQSFRCPQCLEPLFYCGGLPIKDENIGS